METDKLLNEARKIATKGVQINDGHIYNVPAYDLVNYSETIMALVEVIEKVRSLHEFRGVKSLLDCTCGPSLIPCPTRKLVR